jgi:hypothetical protein
LTGPSTRVQYLAPLSSSRRHYFDQVYSRLGLPTPSSDALCLSDFLSFCLFALAFFRIPSGLPMFIHVLRCVPPSLHHVYPIEPPDCLFFTDGLVVSSSLRSTSGSNRRRTTLLLTMAGTGVIASSSVARSFLMACLNSRLTQCTLSVSAHPIIGCVTIYTDLTRLRVVLWSIPHCG